MILMNLGVFFREAKRQGQAFAALLLVLSMVYRGERCVLWTHYAKLSVFRGNQSSLGSAGNSSSAAKLGPIAPGWSIHCPVE
jgi:hypothetical protein